MTDRDREEAWNVLAPYVSAGAAEQPWASLAVAITAALATARREERERCAALVETAPAPLLALRGITSDDSNERELAEWVVGTVLSDHTSLAAAIRALDEEEKP